MNQLIKQKYLKTKGLICLIAVMNMVVPLSLDMYLPAVPQMSKLFNTNEAMVNFTLVGFYFFLAIGILIFGPLSDKYGRKPLLITGSAIYMVFSGACAMAFSIEFFIAARIIQSLGAGCMVAVSTALIKDCFIAKKRDTVLAVVQAMAVIAPMVAPIIGAWIISFSSWRTTFWVLTVIAFFCILASIMLQETTHSSDRHSGNILSAMGRLFAVGKNKGFTAFLLVIALLSAPYMAYIAVCSYVYIDFFSLSEGMYSVFFAINSGAAILGPILYIKINGHINPKTLMTVCSILAAVSGILLIGFGWVAPLMFFLSFLPFTIVESMIRPFSTAILLNQQEHDTGSASSLINFTHTVSGSLGMILGALPWTNFITGLGIILTAFSVIALVGWFAILKSKINVLGLTIE